MSASFSSPPATSLRALDVRGFGLTGWVDASLCHPDDAAHAVECFQDKVGQALGYDKTDTGTGHRHIGEHLRVLSMPFPASEKFKINLRFFYFCAFVSGEICTFQ